MLVASILLLLRTIRVPELARVPLAETHDIELRESGPLMVVVDKPRFRTVQASVFKPFALSVSLEDAAGKVTAATPVLVPLTIEGVGRMRTDIATLPPTPPGRYRLRVSGLAPDVDCADAFLVVARPISKAIFAASIVAIIAASAIALGGLIASVATFVEFQSG